MLLNPIKVIVKRGYDEDLFKDYVLDDRITQPGCVEFLPDGSDLFYRVQGLNGKPIWYRVAEVLWDQVNLEGGLALEGPDSKILRDEFVVRNVIGGELVVCPVFSFFSDLKNQSEVSINWFFENWRILVSAIWSFRMWKDCSLMLRVGLTEQAKTVIKRVDAEVDPQKKVDIVVDYWLNNVSWSVRHYLKWSKACQYYANFDTRVSVDESICDQFEDPQWEGNKLTCHIPVGAVWLAPKSGNFVFSAGTYAGEAWSVAHSTLERGKRGQMGFMIKKFVNPRFVLCKGHF